MSGEDSGYVPPDHKTTAEFGVTRKSAVSGELPLPGTSAEPADGDDLVDDLFDGDVTTHDVPQAPGVAIQDLPSDDPEDDLETTYQDGPGEEPDDDFDATLRDPGVITFQKPPPADTVDELDVTAFQPPATLADIPMEQPAKPAPPVPPPAQPAAFEHGANPAPVYGQPPAPYQERVPDPVPFREPAPFPEPALFPEQPPPSEQAPPAQVAAPMQAEAPWTEQFASEEETANRAEGGPAFAYGMPGAPPPAQSTMPPHPEATVPPMPPPAMASPSGGLPGGPPGGPPPSRSRRPVILILLIALVVVLVLIGVVVLMLGRGSETGGKTAPQASPAASTPATGGGGTGPASPGAPSPGGGAPATPPQSGVPTNQPPGGQQPGGQPGTPPPVTTAPIGPLVQGKGITYQLVQQDSGYFEGKMVITNRTRKPLKAWKVTFKAPGADVKNIWGARLVHGGSTVEIRNLDGVPAIQPGATWDIQFGAAGTASTPKSCEVNGRACGF